MQCLGSSLEMQYFVAEELLLVVEELLSDGIS